MEEKTPPESVCLNTEEHQMGQPEVNEFAMKLLQHKI